RSGGHVYPWRMRTSLWQAVTRPVQAVSLSNRWKSRALAPVDGSCTHNATTAGKPPSMHAARQTIVIVDDDVDTGTALMRALSVFGYHTELFLSPAECLNAIVTR